MRRLRLSVAMSLDGYIAGPNGEYEWIAVDPEFDFGALMRSFDTLVMGRKTYEVARQMGREDMPGMKTFVISRTLRQEDCPSVTLSDDPEHTVRTLKAQAGKDIWLFGGGSLFRSLLERHLVDSVEVAIIPVLLGRGLPLLPETVTQTKLRLVTHRIYPGTGTIYLEYVPA